MKRIYVFCPANIVTGGPDALHQLVYYLRGIGMKAVICYCARKKDISGVPEPYKRYFADFECVKNIIDSSQNIIVCPETLMFYTRKIKNAKIYVWRLSVDFSFYKRDFLNRFKYLLTYPLRYILRHSREKGHARENLIYYAFSRSYNFKKELDVIHLCASYYAYDYVSKRSSKKVEFLIEPISKFFLENRDVVEKKENIVIYNPKKNGKFLQKIIKEAKNISFIPLIGLNQLELINMYSKAKVYIDFGFFPGAERMPKEAVLYDCLIITGKKGASNFYEDVVISDTYKFEEKAENIQKIINLINRMFMEYDDMLIDFQNYKKRVLELEESFVCDLKCIFQKEM